MDIQKPTVLEDVALGTTLTIWKGMTSAKNNSTGRTLTHPILSKDIPSVVAALMGLDSPPEALPMAKRQGSYSSIPVFRVGKVEVSVNSSPQRLREIGLNHLAAAEVAQELIDDHEASVAREKALKELEERRVAANAAALNRDKVSRELFSEPWSELSQKKRIVVDKFRALQAAVDASSSNN